MEANRRRDLNHIRIKHQSEDADSSSLPAVQAHPGQHTYNRTFSFLRTARIASEIIPAIGILLLPFSVHASLLASLTGFFVPPNGTGTTTHATDTVTVTAANVPLLDAFQNPDPMQAIGGGDVTVNNGALVSTGPVGANVIAATKQDSANSGQISVYVVRPGDTLSQIAEMYGVTTNTILWANDLKGPRDIHPGDSLVILPIAGVQHTVQKGESLASIAKKYGGDAADIAAYNGLDASTSLTVGHTIIIPNGEIPNAAPAVHHTAVASSRTGASTHPTEPLRLTPAERATNVPSRVAVGQVAHDQAGWLLNPVPGAIKTQGLHGYNGVDLGAPVGTHVRAAASGEVIVSKASGWSGGYGHYIVIRHNNGVQTLYAHLSKNVVSVGQHVVAGQYIGNIGMTGKTTGPHLHFEVRGAVNPF